MCRVSGHFDAYTINPKDFTHSTTGRHGLTGTVFSFALGRMMCVKKSKQIDTRQYSMAKLTAIIRRWKSSRDQSYCPVVRSEDSLAQSADKICNHTSHYFSRNAPHQRCPSCAAVVEAQYSSTIFLLAS